MTDEPTPIPESEPQIPAPEPPAAPGPAPEPVKTPPIAGKQYIWGTGRRKTAVARVRVRRGEGKFIVNNKDVDTFFCIDRDRAMVRKPLEVTDTGKIYDVFVNVKGGGITGQTGAVVLGLARALRNASADYEPKLREYNLLSRDPRKVERKKYGQRGARRRFQFSKR